MGTTNFDSISLGGDLAVSGTISGNVDISSTLKFGDGEAIVDSSGNEEIVFGVTSSAVNEVKVTNAATGNAPSIAAQGGDSNVAVLLKGKGTGAVQLGQATSVGVTLMADQPILDSSANELVKFVKTASAVNEITVTNAATGSPAAISATGGDTNISLSLVAKGTGVVSVDNGTKTATASGGAATLNKQSGLVTSEALTTAGLAEYTLTLTNDKIGFGSILLASVGNGTNNQGTPFIRTVTQGSGSATIIVRNGHATEALNGTIKISFLVL